MSETLITREVDELRRRCHPENGNTWEHAAVIRLLDEVERLRVELAEHKAHPVRCRQCLEPVELLRHCWVNPHCYACMPLPELETIDV